MTAVRVACAGRATAHVRIPEHADHAALKAAAGAALGDPYDLRLAAPRALRPGDDPWAPLWEREDWGAVPLVRQLEDDDGWRAARTSFARFADERYARDARAVLATIEAGLTGKDARAAADALDRCWEFAHCARNFGVIKASAALAEAVAARLAQFWRRRWEHGEDRALERCCVAAWKLAEAGADAALVDAGILEPLGEMLAHFGETLEVTDAPPPDEGLCQACLGCLRDLAGVSVLARALLGRNASALDGLAARFAAREAPSAAQLRLAQTSVACLWAGVGAAYGGAADDRRYYAERGACASLARLVAATTTGAPFVAVYGVACVCKLASERDAPAGAKINQCVSVPRYRAEARGYSAETWDFYAQAHAPLLEGVDAALDAASAFGAAVLVASPMLTARERERAGPSRRAACSRSRRSTRRGPARARRGGPVLRRRRRRASVVDAAGAVEAWLHAITRGAAEGLRPESSRTRRAAASRRWARCSRGAAPAGTPRGSSATRWPCCATARRSGGRTASRWWWRAPSSSARAAPRRRRSPWPWPPTSSGDLRAGRRRAPRGAPRPARARLAAALMALAGAAPVREESAARAALRRFRQARAAARAFAGDVHIRALLDELAGGADEQAREKRQRVQAARAGLHRALAEDAGRAASDDADDAELDEAARRDGAAGWDPPRARLLAHALCAALAADPPAPAPRRSSRRGCSWPRPGSRGASTTRRRGRRRPSESRRGPRGRRRHARALCRAVVASCVEIKSLRRVRAESSTRRTG